MPKLFGKEMTKDEITQRVGDITQIAGAVRFTYNEGRAKGTDAIEVKTGSGLRFVVLPDKGMNIAYTEYKGINISYISKTGVVAPTHYDETDFLRSFEGGLLTTCGLTYMGAPCVDQGVSLGAHGRVSNIPAYDVSVIQGWNDDGEYEIKVCGKVRESSMFGENILLCRTIKTYLGSDKIFIHDDIVNEGYNPTPLMVLYHMNFGFPLLSEDTVMETNCINLRPRDDDAAPGVNETTVFPSPVTGYKEQVFYRDSVENSYAALVNKKLGLSCRVDFKKEQLPYFVQWKQVGKQEYVVGLEPATNPPDGRAAVRQRGELKVISPGEAKRFDLTVTLNLK